MFVPKFGNNYLTDHLMYGKVIKSLLLHINADFASALYRLHGNLTRLLGMFKYRSVNILTDSHESYF